MKKLKTIKLKDLRNDEVQGFCEKVIRVMEETGTLEEIALISDLKKAHEAFIAAVTKDGISFGDAIQKADSLADQAWSCINTLLKVNMLHFKDEIREAASTIYTAFAAYDNPTNLPYIEEYARMARIINALEAQPAELLERAMIADWFEELKRRCDDFNKCMDAKQDAKASKVIGAAAAARDDIYNAWSDFVEVFNASLVLSKPPTLAQIRDSINTLIDERNQALKTRRTSSKKAADAQA